MADPFATYTDLEDGWRSLSEAEQSRAGVLLARASRMVRARKPGIDTQIAAEKIDADLVGDVVCAMVKRAMQGPVDLDGITQSSQTGGPFSESVTFANPSGDLYFTKTEKVDLGIGGVKAGSIDLLAESSSSSSSSSS